MAGKRKTTVLAERARQYWVLLLGIALFLAVLALCVWYVRLTSTPMASIDLSPASDPARWSFALEDGTVLLSEDGELPASGSDAVVACRTRLDGDLSEKVLFVVTANRADCALFLNDSLVYAPSGRFVDGRFSTSAYEAFSASGQFIAHLTGEDDTLTMLVQLQGDDRSVKHLPKLTLYPDVVNYYTQPMSAAAEAAFPSGMYFALALFVAALFFIGLWKGRADVGLILLTFCSLSMALASTAPYAAYVVAALQWPAGSWFCSTLPIAAMCWTLWYRLSGKIRLYVLPVIGAVSAAMLYYFIAGFGNVPPPWHTQMKAVQSWILPMLLVLLLLAAGIDATRGNPWFRGFFRYLAWSVPVAGAVWGFSALTGGKLAQTMRDAFSRIAAYYSFFALCGQLCILLLILCFLHAVVDLISGLARRDAEMQALSLREKYARENVETMLASQEETRRLRHEMKHHIALMDEMLAKREYERAGEYIRSLSDKVSSLPSDAYSKNLVINAIAGRYLNAAKSEGVAVTSDIHTSENIALRDEELCVLLTNMLENALESCRATPDGAERFIRFKLRSSEDHLTVCCENSASRAVSIGADGSITTSKEDKERHGYGVAAMRQIVEQRDGQFTVSCADGRFIVEATV